MASCQASVSTFAFLILKVINPTKNWLMTSPADEIRRRPLLGIYVKLGLQDFFASR